MSQKPIRWEEHRARDHAEQLVQLCILLTLALVVTLILTVLLPAMSNAAGTCIPVPTR
jgi:hypothetical protein